MDERFDCLEKRLDGIDKKVDAIMEMVAVGKAAVVGAKLLGWGTAVVVAIIEIYRTFKS